MFAALQLDSYISIVNDTPGLLRYQKINLPLPVSDRLWSAATLSERRNLQWSEPAGRERRSFASLMRDSLKTMGASNVNLPLNEGDFHLGLCVMRIGVWEAAQEFNCCSCSKQPVGDNFEAMEVEQPSEPTFEVWREHLKGWRRAVEKISPQLVSPVSLTVFHLSQISLHANLELLQGTKQCFTCAASAFGHQPNDEAEIQAWAASKDARRAAVSAAQLRRIVTEPTPRQESAIPVTTGLNPLAKTSMLHAAIVLCSYAYLLRTCPQCTSATQRNSVPHIVQLLDAFGPDDEQVEGWVDGDGPAALGSVPLCKCHVRDIAECFGQNMKGEDRRSFERFFKKLIN